LKQGNQEYTKSPHHTPLKLQKNEKNQKIKEVEENQPIKNLELDYTVIN
jgi:hypothetical protein